MCPFSGSESFSFESFCAFLLSISLRRRHLSIRERRSLRGRLYICHMAAAEDEGLWRQLRSEEEEKIKKGVAMEMSSEYKSLCHTDRRFIKTYFGFIGCKELSSSKTPEVLKDKDSSEHASEMARDVLWPRHLTKEDEEYENRIFDIRDEVLREDNKFEVPTIFPQTLESMKDLFTQGRERGRNELDILIRCFQVDQNQSGHTEARRLVSTLDIYITIYSNIHIMKTHHTGVP